MDRFRGWIASPLVGLVLAAVFGGVAFGLAETLRRPAGQVLLAARILGELEPADAVASVERVGGRSLRARCGPLGSEASLITLSDGARLLVRSERVRILREGHAVPTSP